ncbi:hypothetical protein HZS_6542 [Henneguya salminicola]|nr:hypothetical protein HZS_6542 [Henneguya salminicola]
MFHTDDDSRNCRNCYDFNIFNIFKKKNPNLKECPPDRAELGRCTWTFLHTVAANYPENPTPDQQKSMENLVKGVTEFYPCKKCAIHLRTILNRNEFKLDTTSTINLSFWMCRLHNEVNKMLGKDQFDCKKVFERWKFGPKDNSC